MFVSATRTIAVGRWLMARVRVGNDHFQYVQVIQLLTKNFWFGLQIGRTCDYSDIQQECLEYGANQPFPGAPAMSGLQHFRSFVTFKLCRAAAQTSCEAPQCFPASARAPLGIRIYKESYPLNIQKRVS